MTTIHLTHRQCRPARPRRRTELAVETMEGRLALSSTLPLPQSGAAAAVVVEYLPPSPSIPVRGEGIGVYPPDPCTSQSYRSFWADGPVHDRGLGHYPTDPRPDPNPPPGGNGGEPIIHPLPSPPPGGNGNVSMTPGLAGPDLIVGSGAKR